MGVAQGGLVVEVTHWNIILYKIPPLDGQQKHRMKAILLLVQVISVVLGEDFSEEEQAVLEELKEAGLLETNIYELLERSDDGEYYNEEPFDGLIDYDVTDYNDHDLIPDGLRDRGGPRRRRRPTNQRKRQGLGPRPNAFQVLTSRLFFGAGNRGSQPSTNYGSPKKKRKPPYSRPKPAYSPPKKKKRPSYHKPKPTYNKPAPAPTYEEPKPSYQEPEEEDEYGSSQAPVSSYAEPAEENGEYASPQAPVKQESDEYGSPKAPVYSAPAPAPAPSYKPKAKPHYKPKPNYKPKPKYKPKPQKRPVYKQKPKYKPRPKYKPKPKYKPRLHYKPKPKPTYKPKPKPSYSAPAPSPSYAPA